jgi:hypothetical protein
MTHQCVLSWESWKPSTLRPVTTSMNTEVKLRARCLCVLGGDVAVKNFLEDERLTADITFIWTIVLSSVLVVKIFVRECRLIQAILTDESLNVI